MLTRAARPMRDAPVAALRRGTRSLELCLGAAIGAEDPGHGRNPTCTSSIALPLVAALDFRAALQAQDLPACRGQQAGRLHLSAPGRRRLRAQQLDRLVRSRRPARAHGRARPSGSTWCARSGRSRCSSPTCRPRKGATSPSSGTRRWRARSANIRAGWASAAVPLTDTRVAIDVVDDAVNRLGLMGVNLPGSIGSDARIDADASSRSMPASKSSACRSSCIRPTPCLSICSTATTARFT